jgi:serine/threonine protein kinase
VQYLAPEVILSAGHDENVDWWSLGVLLFEMLTGSPPFEDPTPDELFENIVLGNIKWREPNTITPLAQLLIRQLLVYQPADRLGSQGLKDICSHPFFDGIDWPNLHRLDPPCIPEQCVSPDAIREEEMLIRQTGGEEGLIPLSAVTMASRPAAAGGCISGGVQGPRDDSSDFSDFSYCDFESSVALTDPAIIERTEFMKRSAQALDSRKPSGVRDEDAMPNAPHRTERRR